MSQRHGLTLLELLLATAMLTAAVAVLLPLMSAREASVNTIEGQAESIALRRAVVKLLDADDDPVTEADSPLVHTELGYIDFEEIESEDGTTMLRFHIVDTDHSLILPSPDVTTEISKPLLRESEQP